MRYPAPGLLGLLAVAGCNEIWRLDRDVRIQDGGMVIVDADPSRPRIKLTAQVTMTERDGYMSRTLEYPPFTSPPAVQIGLVGGPLEPAPYGPDGTVSYPVEWVGQPWRLLYTLPDGIPREVHWSPPGGDLIAHIVEPVFGRLSRKEVPRNSGYEITPSGSPTHTRATVFTTGIWTQGETIETTTTPTLNYEFDAKAVSLSGPRGMPEKAAFDHGILADFRNGTFCRATGGVASFVVPDLATNAFTPPAQQPVYFAADKQGIVALGGPTPITARLQTLLGTRSGTTGQVRAEYGYLPSIDVFAFTRPPSAQGLDFLLPGPQMLTFASCAFAPGQPSYMTDVFADAPDIRERFPGAMHVEVVNQRTRTSDNLTLTSGFAGVVTSSDYDFDSQFLVAAPINIQLLRDGAPIADLEEVADEATPLSAGAGTLELAFDVEGNPLLATHYVDVTLYSVVAGNLNLQRVYTVTQTVPGSGTQRKLTLDPSFLLPGGEYVFQLRAYHGRPEIGRANFSINTYPQYAATIFTRTFKMP